MKNCKVVLIIQVRMGSIRLPGKSMMLLGGKPIISQIIERVKRCKKVNEIVLATSTKDEDNILIEVAKKYKIKYFRGNENDLVDRYYKAAKEFKSDYVVRLPADNPVVEPEEIDRIIEHHLNSDNDFSANTHNILNNEYPDGLGAEIYNYGLLEMLWKETIDPRNREHPHTYVYEHPEKFRIGTVKCPKEFRRPDLVLDVNTIEDYNFISAIYDYFVKTSHKEFHITDIIKWYDNIYKKGVESGK